MRTMLLDDELTTEERQHIQQCLAQIAQGDYGEFDEREMLTKGLE